MFRLAGVLLVLLLIYRLVAQAKVAPSITARDEDSSSSKRTLFDIVWGCVSTTIICAWAAIHPNIPPREGPFKRTLRRLELMFWTVVAPEILPCWALNQLLAAITVRDVYNDAKGYHQKRCGVWMTLREWFSLLEIKEAPNPAWTVAHGHFLVMGGFHLVEPEVDDGSTRLAEASPGTEAAVSDALDVPPTKSPLIEETDADTEKGYGAPENMPELEQGRVTILTLEMLRELVKDSEFKIPTAEEEITDKSKGDALSKLIFILQSTWFILHCLGRRVQGLNLTQFELTTLALASLNGITFVLWWDKPLGAQATVRVYLKRKLTDVERVQLEVRDNSMRSEVIVIIGDFFATCVSLIRDAFVCQSEGNTFLVWLVWVPSAIIALPLIPLFAFSFIFLANLYDLAETTSSSFPPDDTRVPTFYVPRHRYSNRYHILLLITLAAIFGGIHCSGWNFPFPTFAEQKLWRVASLAVTILPIATFPFGIIVDSIHKRVSPAFQPFVEFPGALGLLLCALVYVSARLVLLGLAFSLLRHLPPTAFIAVDWTRFYPHIL